MVVILLSFVNLSMFCIEQDFVNCSTFFSFSLKCLNKSSLEPLIIMEVDTSSAGETLLAAPVVHIAVSWRDVFFERVTGRREIC